MGETHLWISDQRIAHDLLTKRARIYSSRPPVPAVPGSNTQAQYLPLMAHDEAWRRQRKFVQTMLSTAANAKYNGYIDHEAKRFLFSLLNEPKGYYSLIEEFCGRISARLNYGKSLLISSTLHQPYAEVPQAFHCHNNFSNRPVLSC